MHTHKAIKTNFVYSPTFTNKLRKTGVEQIEVCECGAKRWVWITTYKTELGAWE